MDDYLVGVLSNIGVISFVALSAYLLLLTGEISFGQQAFFAIGAYAAGIATAMWGWPLRAGARPGARRSRRRRGRAGRRCRRCGCTASTSRSRRSPSPRWCGILFELFRYQVDDRRRAGRARTAPTASAASATSSRTTSSPLQFLVLIYGAAGAWCSLGFMLLERSRLGVDVAHDRRGPDCSPRCNGIAVARVKVLAAGARRRARRRSAAGSTRT